MLDIAGNEKVVYAEGEEVTFNLNGKLVGRGNVRGLASSGLIDLWIVQYHRDQTRDLDPEVYPYSCLVVPHTLMRRT